MTAFVYYGMDGQPLAREEAIRMMCSKEGNRVARDVRGDVTVSTVLLYLDHGWGDGPPVLFETMIFGGEHDEYQERYCTLAEAKDGHARAYAAAFGTSTKEGEGDG